MSGWGHKVSTVFCAGYLGSMGGTLYAALALHSYILSLVCCAAQVSSVPCQCLHPGHADVILVPVARGTHCEGHFLWHGRWWRCCTTWSPISLEAPMASSLS